MKPIDSTQVMDPWLQLASLARCARGATKREELAFLAVNDSRALAPYRQAALWFADGGVSTLSGVVELEANAPYVQWLNRLCRVLHETHGDTPAVVTAVQLPEALAGEWADWLPAQALWLPCGTPSRDAGGLLLAAEQPWSETSVKLLKEWVDTWHHAWSAQIHGSAWTALARALRQRRASTPWWQRRRTWAAAALLAAMWVPVPLSVLAPGELVPTKPAVVRAPLDGVIGQFLVQPNQQVRAGQALFAFDEAPIATRLTVAAQTQASAEAEYRQYAQQAVSDQRSKAQLSALLGKIEEKRAEADFLRTEFERSRVVAPQDGVALFDDPTEWIGKPVQTGERILRIAAPGDVEVEAWLPMGDAIPLPDKAVLRLYLAADPLASVSAQVRYVAHGAVARPDGTYAYRVRAVLDAPTAQRVGLKGTAKIEGGRVPLVYWMMRRPLSAVRQALGI